MNTAQDMRKGQRTRSHILKTAMGLFNTKGYHATSIADIVIASGVQKGNLYFYFTSKEDLALALLDEAHELYMAYLGSHAGGAKGLGKLEKVLAAIVEYHESRSFMGGCIFGNIALEMADQNPRFRQSVLRVFDAWSALFTGLLEEAMSQGELPATLSPERLARHIIAALEGGIMLSRLTKDKADIINSIDSIHMLLHTEKQA